MITFEDGEMDRLILHLRTSILKYGGTAWWIPPEAEHHFYNGGPPDAFKDNAEYLTDGLVPF